MTAQRFSDRFQRMTSERAFSRQRIVNQPGWKQLALAIRRKYTAHCAGLLSPLLLLRRLLLQLRQFGFQLPEFTGAFFQLGLSRLNFLQGTRMLASCFLHRCIGFRSCELLGGHDKSSVLKRVSRSAPSSKSKEWFWRPSSPSRCCWPQMRSALGS